jgi:DNA-binding MarR family transcriptional regulator
LKNNPLKFLSNEFHAMPRSVGNQLERTPTKGRVRTACNDSKRRATRALSESGEPLLIRTPNALARSFQLICATMIAEALADEDLVPLEYGSLLCLEIQPGIDQRRLGEAMGIVDSHASLITDCLHSKGLVERRTSGNDRRAHELYLTPKGKSLWQRLHPKASAANERVLAPLAPRQRKIFLDLLVQLVEGNRAHSRPGAGRRERGAKSFGSAP